MSRFADGGGSKRCSKTLRNRPDLLHNAELSAEDRTFLRALEPGREGAQSKDSV